MRLAGGLSGTAVIGWDMGAALALGAALGIAPLIIAELLPPVEAVMVRRMGERTDVENGSDGFEGVDS